MLECRIGSILLKGGFLPNPPFIRGTPPNPPFIGGFPPKPPRRNGCFSVLPASLIANASDMGTWIRWNLNCKPVSDGVIRNRGIVQCLSKNEQTFLCYWWYSILVCLFFKLFYFIGAVPSKTPQLLAGFPPNPPTIQIHKLSNT